MAQKNDVGGSMTVEFSTNGEDWIDITDRTKPDFSPVSVSDAAAALATMSSVEASTSIDTMPPILSKPLNQDEFDRAMQDLKTWFNKFIAKVNHGSTEMPNLSATAPIPRWEDLKPADEGRERSSKFGIFRPAFDDLITSFSTDDLKPCQFCGNTRALDVMCSESDGLEKWWVECNDCDTSGPQGESTRDDMAYSWNQRPLDA